MKGGIFRANRANFVVVVIIALAVVASFSIASYSSARVEPSGLTAVVHAAHGETYRLPLDTDTVVIVETDLGMNEVTVENARIRVTQSDCKNHDCMRQGAIYTPGQRIICLPHEFYIEIVGARATDDSDKAGAEGDALVDADVDAGVAAGDGASAGVGAGVGGAGAASVGGSGAAGAGSAADVVSR